MRHTYLILLFSLLVFSCNNKKEPVQEKKIEQKPDTVEAVKNSRSGNSYSPVDISPMDMSYFPIDYPKLKTKTTTETPLARIVYSRPHLQGRNLFHDILKYGEPWRLGANESSELDLYKPAVIQGKELKAGRYVIYCIPEKDTWTIVLNSNVDSWGLHPDQSKDIARFSVPIKQISERLEYFTMIFRPSAAGADLVMAWGNVEAVLPISF